MTEIFPLSLFYLPPAVVIGAFLLDWAIGDPRWLPHPVRLMGRGISRFESYLRPSLKNPRQERLGGTVLTALIVGATVSLSVVAVLLLNLLGGFASALLFLLSFALLLYLTATTLALKELIGSAQEVMDLLKRGQLQEARAAVGLIVGRDTDELTAQEIEKAVIETLAENLSDGVIAPLFYLSLGGLPLAMAYKAVNTLDSMVGYRNERYRHFGRAAAKVDDLANYLPARVSGLLIAVSAGLMTGRRKTLLSSWKTMLTDGRRHLSPNAGIPEAAMAGALGVRLGGPARYGGVLVEKPYIGNPLHDDYLLACGQARSIVVIASLLGLLLSLAVLFLREGI